MLRNMQNMHSMWMIQYAKQICRIKCTKCKKNAWYVITCHNIQYAEYDELYVNKYVQNVKWYVQFAV